MSGNFGKSSDLAASLIGNNQAKQLPIHEDKSTFEVLPDELLLLILKHITEHADWLALSLVCKKWFDIISNRLTLCITKSLYSQLYSKRFNLSLFRTYNAVTIRGVEFDLDTLPERFDKFLKACKFVKFDSCCFKTPEAVTLILFASKNTTGLNFHSCEFDDCLEYILENEVGRNFKNALIEELSIFDSWELLKVVHHYGIKLNKLNMTSFESINDIYQEMLEFAKQHYGTSVKQISMEEFQKEDKSNEFLRTLLNWDDLHLESLRYVTMGPNELMSKVVKKQTSLKSLECEGSIKMSNVSIGLLKLTLNIFDQTRLMMNQLVRSQNLKSLTLKLSIPEIELDLSIIDRFRRLQELTLSSDQWCVIESEDVSLMMNVQHLKFSGVRICNDLAHHCVISTPNVKTLWFDVSCEFPLLPFRNFVLSQLTTLGLPEQLLVDITFEKVFLPNLKKLFLLKSEENDVSEEMIQNMARYLNKCFPLLNEIRIEYKKIVMKRDSQNIFKSVK